MKKLLIYTVSVFVLVLLSASVIAVNALAAASEEDVTRVTDKICEAVDDVDDSLDISGYGVTTDQIDAIYQTVKEENPRFFYLTSMSWYYNTSTNVISKLEFVYIDTADNVIQMKADYEAAVTKALSCVSDEMSQAERAVAIHDYLILHTTGLGDSDISKSAYGALVRNESSCKGYIYAYKDLMTRLGISCIAVYCSDSNYAWNMVQLDGAWYHVDILADDPSCTADNGWHNDDTKMRGRVQHDHLLLSDSAIESLGYSNWVSGLFFTGDGAPDASNKTYDGLYSGIASGMFYSEGYWYYSLSGSLVRSHFDLSDSRVFPTGGEAGFISLADGYVYYISTASDGTTREIRRIGADGTGDAAVIHVGLEGNETEEITELLIDNGSMLYTVYFTGLSNTARCLDSHFNVASFVMGVSNGGSYKSNLTLTYAEGTATLNGAEFVSGGMVTTEGEYILTVTGNL